MRSRDVQQRSTKSDRDGLCVECGVQRYVGARCGGELTPATGPERYPERRLDASIWSPVVAALGTGAIGFGGLVWQQRHRDKKEAEAEKAAAYHLLIAESLGFTIRAGTLRLIMRARSGLGEGVELLLGMREPFDLMKFHDWFAEGYQPMNVAWSRIQVTGSPEAVRVATELMNAAVVKVATTPGEGRGKAMATIRGLAWTEEQQTALDEAGKRVVAHREAFIKLVRKELSMKAAEFTIEVPNLPGATEDDAATYPAQAPLPPGPPESHAS